MDPGATPTPRRAERAGEDAGKLGAWPFHTWNSTLLCAAFLAACVVYAGALRSGWFYDDQENMLDDPRLDHLELFLPGHWTDAPPPLVDNGDPLTVLPGYGKPLIADRYLWRLSFALERWLCAGRPSSLLAHSVNIGLHLACIGALFLALERLLRLYRNWNGVPASSTWDLLPGLAALIFAIHPWATEPVVYVSARNASMGTFFVLLGLWAWCGAWEPQLKHRAAHIVLAMLCALAAFGCKENFIAAPAGYFLAVWPLVWRRLRQRGLGPALACLGAAACALALAAWLGIHGSARASSLFAQSAGGRGWQYFFEIQNPLLLLTLGDQFAGLRLSIETGHPDWPGWACVLGLLAHIALCAGGAFAALRRPLALGLCWFYVFLLPTNSFLPRPDFLAGRNVYLPVAGIATLFAGGLLYAWTALATRKRVRGGGRGVEGTRAARRIVLALGLLAGLYWAWRSWDWVQGFKRPELVWARSALVAPEHSVVRLNLAGAILARHRAQGQGPSAGDLADAERELQAALQAEETPTMRYQTQRPSAMRRALAWRLLGQIRGQTGKTHEALRFLQRSWILVPSRITWLLWADLASRAGSPEDCKLVTEEGLRRWPEAWWPRAMRG